MQPICVSLRHSFCLSTPVRSSAFTNASRILSPGVGDVRNSGVRVRGGTYSGVRVLSVASFCSSGDEVLVENSRERVLTEEEEGEDSIHVPVLLKEVIGGFEGRRLPNSVDCTLSAGGHACAVLSAHSEMETFIKFDVDPVAHAQAQPRLQQIIKTRSSSRSSLNLPLIRANFKNIKNALGEFDPKLADGGVDGILMDLGMSSMKVNEGERGFSFVREGPVNMRMDPTVSFWSYRFKLSFTPRNRGRGSRQVTRCWPNARNLSVNSASANSFTISESPLKRQRRKNTVKAGSSNATEAERAALHLLKPAANVDARLLLASFDQDSQPGNDIIAEELAAMTGTISICEHVPIAVRSVCVGIDPDLSGAIAVLRTENNTTSGEVIDVPCVTVAVNKKMRRRHDYQAIAKLVRQLQAPEGSIAYVEQAMPFPKDGKQGWYITGYGYGVWLGILAAAGFTVIPVQARVWKTAMGICGKDFTKDDSRALAASLFPDLSPQLKRKKDHGRAEALLIAAFGKGMVPTHLPPGGISSEVLEFPEISLE